MDRLGAVMIPAVTTVEPQLLLLPHHPDLANRPEPRPGHVAVDTLRAALLWNTFRTLALVSPPFWVRRLRARLVGLSSVEHAPQVLRVRMWPRLATPVRAGSSDVHLDVLIETDQVVFGMMACDTSDVTFRDDAAANSLLEVIDAVSWHAGVRQCYVGVITAGPEDAPIASALVERYRASRDGLLRRLPHRHDGLVNLRGIGRMTWQDLLSVLRDCSRAAALDEMERYVTGRTAAWIESLGIRPAD
jgi:hypothetical protein